MTKREAKAVSQLIVIGIVLYPFFWFYQQVGANGFISALVLLICAFIAWKIIKRNRRQKAFDEVALYVLHNRLAQDEVKSIFMAALRWGEGRQEVIRNLKVLRESVDLSLKSEKRDTAETRMETVEECYEALLNKCPRFVSPAVMQEIAQVVEETRERFKTMLFVNVAHGYIKKAASLKTTKSRLKYLGLAQKVIEEGLEQDADNTNLHQALIYVYQMSESLSEPIQAE